MAEIKEKIKLSGKMEARNALAERLKKLKADSQNESENVRGFTQGGSSVKSSGKDEEKEIAEQIAMIEAELAQVDKEISAIEKEVGKVIDVMQQDIINEKTTAAQQPNNLENLEALAAAYKKFGIDCEVEIKDGKAGIIVKEEGEFKDQDILKMDEKDLDKMLDEHGKDAEMEEEKEVGKGKEKEQKEDKKSATSNTEKTDEKEKDKKGSKHMSLMPGDIVEERDEQKEKPSKPMLISRTKEQKEKKKEPQKEDKKEKDEEVAIPEHFDDSLLEEMDIQSPAKKSRGGKS